MRLRLPAVWAVILATFWLLRHFLAPDTEGTPSREPPAVLSIRQRSAPLRAGTAREWLSDDHVRWERTILRADP